MSRNFKVHELLADLEQHLSQLVTQGSCVFSPPSTICNITHIHQGCIFISLFEIEYTPLILGESSTNLVDSSQLPGAAGPRRLLQAGQLGLDLICGEGSHSLSGE